MTETAVHWRHELTAVAQRAAGLLAAQQVRVVFAESCTAGLISASLSRVPGISAWLCGSAVVYQVPTKIAWLNVPAEMLAAHGDVSQPVAQALAEGVLQQTPHADLALSITGHLGPQAPAALDGVVVIGVAGRGRLRNCRLVREHRLMTNLAPASGPPSLVVAAGNSESELTGDWPGSLREQRQVEATIRVLELLCEHLGSLGAGSVE